MFDDLLRPRLPAAAADYVADVLRLHRCEVRLSPPRRTKLGDHRPPGRGRRNHRITLNDDLNPYAFLTTLLHEVAHAAAWERQRGRWRRQRPHGPAWQEAFASLLGPVVADAGLPDDVRDALAGTMRRPAAASCSDRTLALVLAHYDAPRPGLVRVEALAPGTLFRTDCGGVFRAGPRVRSRWKCHECATGREWRVHGLARVEVLEAPVAVSGSAAVGRRCSGRSAGASRPRAPRDR